MKLFGVKNDKYVVASIAHYDCIGIDELMADGGQIGTNDYAGYTRGSGERCCFEVPQNFAELYTDYNNNRDNRKYGIWPIDKVKLLDKKLWPKKIDMAYKAENFIWGHRGPNGDQPLTYSLIKDLTTEHLKAIIEYSKKFPINEETYQVIKYILKKRK